MACVVCQHCENPISKDAVTIKEGCSYHRECHKCYVCSETNLANAAVFKGVIFCSGCSQRMFQGCYTARKMRNRRSKPSSRIKKRGRNLHQAADCDRRTNRRQQYVDSVLEQTRLAALTDTDSSRTQRKRSNSDAQLKKQSNETDVKSNKEEAMEMKQNSKEMGMTTEVTQELLRQMACPVIEDCKYVFKYPVKSPHKETGDSQFNKTVVCSDLRVAELGASTEIAHMALRKRSEVPVIMRTDVKEIDSASSSGLQEDSDASADDDEDWLESTGSTKQKFGESWLDKRVRSFIKMPYSYFMKNIIHRSSVVGVTEDENHGAFVNRIKCLFQQDITEHQRRGVKRLYSTINRRRTPYKLGWLDPTPKAAPLSLPSAEDETKKIRDEENRTKKCKHFKGSHSYRCMRAQVMRLAGPTKSELACVRNKMMKVFTPLNLIRDLAGSTNKSPAILLTKACGKSTS